VAKRARQRPRRDHIDLLLTHASEGLRTVAGRRAIFGELYIRRGAFRACNVTLDNNMVRFTL
ncbi:MAG TPA: hypothetical protein VLL57_03845, partial [Candidatus Binataceae bacterium]|nr:hypothetical protein [Candidatus Binataceae bacterium]